MKTSIKFLIGFIFIFVLSNCMVNVDDEYTREKKLLTLLVNSASSSKSTSTSTTATTNTSTNTGTSTSTSTSVAFSGTVVNSISSIGISGVSVTTNPYITTETTDASGAFKLNVGISSNTEYTIIFKKYGYYEKTVKQSTPVGTKDLGQIQMSRDTANFKFIDVTVKDSTTGNLLGGVSFNYTIEGSTLTETTGTSGLISIAVPISATSQTFTISRTGYKSTSGNFDIYTGVCSNTSNATYSCQPSSITVSLQTNP